MKKFNLLLIVSVFLLLVSCGSKGSDGGNKEFRLTTAHNLNTPQHELLLNLASKLEKASGGKSTLKLYMGAQLGDQQQGIELAKSGAIELAFTGAAVLENFVPLYGIFSLPYLIRDFDHAKKIIESDKVLKTFQEESMAQGFLPIMIIDGFSRNFYATKAILKPEDMNGLKFRIQPSPVYSDIVRALGGSPIPMSSSELYSGLQQGIVDGAENNPNSIYQDKLGEIVKHYSFTETTRTIDIIVMSVKTWESLSTEDQKMWLDISKETTGEFIKTFTDIQLQKIELAKKEMGVEFHYPDKAPFIEKTKPIIDAWVAKDAKNKQVYDLIQSM